jgi:hypothetical protein
MAGGFVVVEDSIGSSWFGPSSVEGRRQGERQATELDRERHPDGFLERLNV